MRLMWRRFGPQTPQLAPARGYTVADVEDALAEVSGDRVFAREFFARYINGSELPDYRTLLGQAGFLVRTAAPQQAWMGDTRLSALEGEVVVAGPTTIGSPMYAVGLSAGDRILTLDSISVATTADVARALAASRPGATMRVTWQARDGQRSGTMTLRGNPRVEVVPYEDAGRTPTDEQLAFRRSWLASRQQ
jgi:predicted metalloprotease with PDZ domain